MVAHRAPLRRAAVAGARSSGFDSRLPDVWPGGGTEACRSDTAAAVVRLHLGPLHRNREARGESRKEKNTKTALMRPLPESPRSPFYSLLSRSNIRQMETACSSTVRAGSL